MEINNELIRSLGMALVHSLWEGLIILVLILFALSLAGRSNARLRYTVFVSGHFLLLASFLSTWYIVYHHSMATAIKPLTRAYSDMNGLVGSSSIALQTAELASTLNQFLEPLYPALAAGWIMGFIFMLIRMAGGFYLSYNIIRKDILHPDPFLHDLFEKAKTNLVVPAKTSLRMSARQISPMVVGIIKPCVIVPAAILSGLTTQQVEAILVHELAHIRRYDHVMMIFQAIITQILFFHPVAWFLSAGIDRERENCCDDLVIKNFPNPINYIKALTMIQEMNVDGQVPANALLGRSKRLLGRVKRLLKTEKRQAPAFRMAVVFLLFVTLGIAAITIVSAGNPGNKGSIGKFLTVNPGNMQIVTDTIRTKKHEKIIVKEGSSNQDDIKKQKELEEARRKMEKAHKELEKARLEMEKASEEFARAGGQMQRHDLASEEKARHFMMEDQMREFKLRHEKASDVQRKVMELQRRAMEEHIRHSKERMRNDSNKIWVHPHMMMHTPPVAPFPPGVPPPDINMDVPSPDINMEIADPDIITPPEPVIPLELLNEEQVQPDPEQTKSLDSTLKELEGE